MRLIVFLTEVIVVLFYLDSEYQISEFRYTPSSHEDYSAYYSFDIVDNKILTLSSAKENEKIKIWKASPIQFEVLEYFPKIEEMREIYRDRVVDNGLFKSKFENYMIELYESYICGEIDADEFKKAFLNPPSNIYTTF